MEKSIPEMDRRRKEGTDGCTCLYECMYVTCVCSWFDRKVGGKKKERKKERMKSGKGERRKKDCFRVMGRK
jgi:hypothetical protein